METTDNISTAILESIIANEKKRKILLSLPHYTVEFRVIAKYVEYLITNDPRTKILICTNTDIPKSHIISELSSKGLTELDSINNYENNTNSKTISIININDYVTSKNSNLLNTKFNAIILIYCQEMGLSDPKIRMRRMMDEFGDTTTILGIDDDIDKASIFFGKPIYTLSIEQATEYNLFRKYSRKYNHDIHVRDSILELMKEPNNPRASKILAQSIIANSRTGKTLVLCDSLEISNSISKSINKIRNLKSVVIEQYNPENIADFLENDIDHIAFYRRNDISTDDFFLNLQNLIILHLEENQIYDFEKYILPFLKTIGSSQQRELTAYEYTLTIIKDIISINGLHDSDMKPVIGAKKLSEILLGIMSSLNPNNTAQMIGIFGQWGRGKTFLMRLMEEELTPNKVDKKDNKNKEIWRFINYSAWKYQESSAIGVCLYNLLKKQFNTDKSPKDHIICFLRKYAISIVVILILSAVICFADILGLSNISYVIDILKIITFICLIRVFLKGEIISKIGIPYVNITYYRDFLGPNIDIKDNIKNLIIDWKRIHKNKKFRLAIFVDDLDRCDETKLISTIDAFRTFLDDDEMKEVIVIAALDEGILTQALKNKYDRQKDNSNNKDSLLIKEYIDKLFCLSIKLPSLTNIEKEEFTSAFIDFDYRPHESQPNQKIKSKPIQPPVIPVVPNQQPAYLKKDKVCEGLEQYKSFNTQNISEFERNKIVEIISTSKYVKTPRHIRIIYYRYKLIKALLKNINDDSFNYWFSEQNIITILNLIIEMSYKDNFVSINDCIEQHAESNKQFSNRVLSFSIDMYISELEKVLTMVIPY